MVWGGVSSKGKTTLRFVAPGTKVNSNYYITKVLKPFLARDVPHLFPKKHRIKWYFHQDSAPSHTSKVTIQFLNEKQINYIKPEEWMPSSPDAARMDYSIWGYLKQRLNRTNTKSLAELKKNLIEWRKMSQTYVDKVLASWSKRVLMIYNDRGYHVKHRL